MRYHVVGIMSGTSLDGVDLAYCIFERSDEWSFSIEQTITIQYADEWKNKLANAIHLSSNELENLDLEYGKYLGEITFHFITSNNLHVDYISSHGHTIFHEPHKKITLQIGNGEEIKKQTGKTVIFNFRIDDVLLGGQGAPLVPIGDKLLFHSYDACVNLGGFANISFDQNEERIAYDICAVNVVLNKLCSQIGLEYDKDGKIAGENSLNKELLNELNQLPYYTLKHPKSLGVEWVLKNIFPIIEKSVISIEEKITTYTHHVAEIISNEIEKNKLKKILFTGGGTYNKTLIELINNNTKAEIIIPKPELIEFKEALIFAFLGILKIRNEVNILKSVTGAPYNHVGGRVI